jgi:hypothetical protein
MLLLEPEVESPSWEDLFVKTYLVLDAEKEERKIAQLEAELKSRETEHAREEEVRSIASMKAELKYHQMEHARLKRVKTLIDEQDGDREQFEVHSMKRARELSTLLIEEEDGDREQGEVRSMKRTYGIWATDRTLEPMEFRSTEPEIPGVKAPPAPAVNDQPPEKPGPQEPVAPVVNKQPIAQAPVDQAANDQPPEKPR